MELNLTFWIVAWCLMLVTFLTATGAILIGAKSLDRDNAYPDQDEN
ncbi:MAG: hypothetical protein ACI87E_002468 [Mariniblastus sp.]|jgi:hypothetical protein